MFIKPISYCFCTLGFGTSSFDKNSLGIDVSVVPLYLPPGEDGANLIRRLKRVGEIQSAQEARSMSDILNAIHVQAVPFLSAHDTPVKIASRQGVLQGSGDPYHLQAVALSCALLKDQNRAKEAFGNAVKVLRMDGRGWCLEMAMRLQAMESRMTSDFMAFRSDLIKWREERLASMKLTAFQQTLIDL